MVHSAVLLTAVPLPGKFVASAMLGLLIDNLVVEVGDSQLRCPGARTAPRLTPQ